MKPDFSEFLNNPEKFEQEEANWAKANEEGEGHRVFANVVNELDPASVIEFGCGTGWTASYIKITDYMGVDANIECVKKAEERCSIRLFMQGDIRTWVHGHGDVVLSTAFLKHFGLHEWNTIFARFLNFGWKYAVFTMQIAKEDNDDGLDYPHVWITRDHLMSQLAANGFELIEEIPCAVCELGEEPIFVARRV